MSFFFGRSAKKAEEKKSAPSPAPAPVASPVSAVMALAPAGGESDFVKFFAHQPELLLQVFVDNTSKMVEFMSMENANRQALIATKRNTLSFGRGSEEDTMRTEMEINLLEGVSNKDKQELMRLQDIVTRLEDARKELRSKGLFAQASYEDVSKCFERGANTTHTSMRLKYGSLFMWVMRGLVESRKKTTAGADSLGGEGNGDESILDKGVGSKRSRM